MLVLTAATVRDDAPPVPRREKRVIFYATTEQQVRFLFL